MSKVNVCCNPLKKKKHSKVYKYVFKVPNTYNYKFKNLIGQFLCPSCKSAINKLKESVDFEIQKKTHDSEEVELSDSSDDNINQDPSFVCTEVDESLKRSRVNAFLEDCGQPPIKKHLSKLSKLDKQKLQQSIDQICYETLKNSTNDTNNNNLMNNSWTQDLKQAISKETSRKEKISLLTRIPFSILIDGKRFWTIKRIRKEFNVSRRMVRQAIKLREECGYGSRPKPKKGRPIKAETLDLVEKFYLTDDVSRIMPGIKDYVSVFKDGHRIQEQKRFAPFL